jgi:hypothetical protein
MEWESRKLISAKTNAQRHIPSVGDVKADLATGDWSLNLAYDALDEVDSESARARISLKVTFDPNKSQTLTYVLNQRCIDFIREVGVRQKRQTIRLTGLSAKFKKPLSDFEFKLSSSAVKQLCKLLSLDNIMDVAAMVRQEGERELSLREDEDAIMEAMVRCHADLLDDLGTRLREQPDGIDFLRKLIRSNDEQTLRMSLSLSERVGQLELQNEILDIACNHLMPTDLRQHAIGLLMPELQWRVWAAGRGRKRRWSLED